jgi:ATP-dependent exoDNAse (exonuclease V) beta subunit
MRDTPQMAYGKLLHESLSYIKNHDSLQAAIDRALQGRYALDVTSQKLKQDVERIVSHPQIAPWFSMEGTIISEQEFCSETGELLRPDRVFVSNDNVAVIDYKSGLKQKKHIAQITTYKTQLEQIYKKPVKGYLVYTEPLEILEIE